MITPAPPSDPATSATRTRRPTVRELPADLLTPVGAFLRLRHRGPAFLLESVERGQQVGRYSFLGAGCRPLPLDASPDGDLFAPLRARSSEHAGADREGLPPFTRRRGRLRRLRRDPALRADRARCPTAGEGDPAAPARFLIADIVVVFDHVRRTIEVIAQPGRDREADEIAAELMGPLPDGRRAGAGALGLARRRGRDRRQQQYEGYVRSAQEHIEAGDAFQIVLSQRHVRPTARRRSPIYRALRAVNPSPYMVFVDFGALQIVSASPETHVSLDARRHRDAEADRGLAPARRRRRRGRRARRRARGATRRSAPST